MAELIAALNLLAAVYCACVAVLNFFKGNMDKAQFYILFAIYCLVVGKTMGM